MPAPMAGSSPSGRGRARHWQAGRACRATIAAGYGVDCNRDGHKSPDDPEDAIPAAARYLPAADALGNYRIDPRILAATGSIETNHGHSTAARRPGRLTAIDRLETGKRGGHEPDEITLETFGVEIPEA